MWSQAAPDRGNPASFGVHGLLGSMAVPQEGGLPGAVTQQTGSGRAFWKLFSWRRRQLFSATAVGTKQLRLPAKQQRAARGEAKRRSLLQWLQHKPSFLRRLSKGLCKRD